MKKLLSRLVKWKADTAIAPKRIESAHEIAIRQGATRQRVDRGTEASSGEILRPETPVRESVAPEEMRRRKKQGRRMAEGKRPQSLMDDAQKAEKEQRRRQKRAAGDVQGTEDVKPDRKSKRRPGGVSFI